MTLGRLDVAAVGEHLPSGLRFLGWGGVAMAAYGLGSTLHYNELIVFAVVRVGWSPAAFITHIYVDDPVSLRGGHDIWGLPKVLADFAWQPRGLQLTVDGELWLTARFAPPHRGLPLPLLVPALGQPGGRLSRFFALGSCRALPRPVSVDVASSAPFARFGLDRPVLTVAGPRLDLRVHRPT